MAGVPCNPGESISEFRQVRDCGIARPQGRQCAFSSWAVSLRCGNRA